jgi:hypothetical protein
MDSKLKQFFDGLKDLINRVTVERRIKEVDTWDGSPANYSTSDAYCAASLIDVNAAAEKDEKSQSHCMLPVREEGDASNVFVDKAVFAAAGGRGIGQVERPADVPETSWNAAVKSAANKLIDAYEQMDRVAPAAVWTAADKEPPEEARALGTGDMAMQLEPLVQQARPGGMPWILDLFHAAEGMSVVFTDQGQLFSAPVNVDGDDVVTLGEVVQVKQEFTPVGRTVLRQQEDGSWRWFSRSAVAVLNRVGEIDSRALFDSFIEHAERTGEYPTRQFYHLLGDAWTVGQFDWLGREGNVLLTSGVYNDSELAQTEIKARQIEPDAWGDSIRFQPDGKDSLEILEVSDGVSVPVYTKGRLIEVSTLPEDRAASWFTSGVVMEERSMEMDTKQFKGLVELFMDEDAAKEWLDKNAGELNRQIKEAGLIARSVDESGEGNDGGDDDSVNVTNVTINAPESHIVGDDELVRAIVEQLEQSEVVRDYETAIEEAQVKITELQETIDGLAQALDSRLVALEEDDDEKRQRYREDMPAPKTVVTYRPSEARRDDNGVQMTAAERAMSTLAEKGIGG